MLTSPSVLQYRQHSCILTYICSYVYFLSCPLECDLHGQGSCFIHAEALAHSRHGINISCRKPFRKLEAPHHVGALKDGIIHSEGPHDSNCSSLCMAIHFPSFSATPVHLDPQFTLYPATDLDKLRWRTNHGECDRVLVRSWQFQPLDHWKKFRVNRLKESPCIPSDLTASFKHQDYTLAATVA